MTMQWPDEAEPTPFLRITGEECFPPLTGPVSLWKVVGGIGVHKFDLDRKGKSLKYKSFLDGAYFLTEREALLAAEWRACREVSMKLQTIRSLRNACGK